MNIDHALKNIQSSPNATNSAHPKPGAPTPPSDLLIAPTPQGPAPAPAPVDALTAPHAEHLTDLPPEVLHRALHVLSGEDLQNTRLACKSLAQVAHAPELPGWHALVQDGLNRLVSPDGDGSDEDEDEDEDDGKTAEEAFSRRLQRAGDKGFLAHMEHLDLSKLGLADAHFQQVCAAFAQSETHKLKHLTLAESPLTASSAPALVQRFPGLQHLNLADTRLGNEGAQVLGEATHITGLEHLDLSRNGLGPQGLGALLQGPHLAALTTLNLNHNPDLGVQGAKIISAATHLSLQVLELRGNDLGDEGVQILAATAHLKSLESINLASNGLTHASVIAVTQSASLKGVRRLDLSYSRFTDASFQALASTEFAPLTHLHLQSTHMKTAGARHVAQSTPLASLEHLDVGSNPLGDAGGAALIDAAPAALRHLDMRGGKELWLRHARLGPLTARALVQGTHLVDLRYLDVSRHNFDRQEARAIQKAPHFADLQTLKL